MQLSFRWLGTEHTMEMDRENRMSGIQAASVTMQDDPIGDVWGIKRILDLKTQIEHAGMSLEVIDRMPVHEHIKLGRADKDRYIENFRENIRRTVAAGVKCICYDFSPLCDQEPHYSQEQRKEFIRDYQAMGEGDLWNHWNYFMKRILPVAEECKVEMAMYPDDPKQMVLGLPYLFSEEETIVQMLKISENLCHGLAFCIGDLPQNLKENKSFCDAVSGRVHYVYLKSAEENRMLKNFCEHGFHGYVCTEEPLSFL